MTDRQESSLARFSHWFAIFANLAVVGGIIFLGVEIRQNSLMMRAQTRNEIAQTLIEMLASEREPELAGALRRLFEGAEPMPQDAYYLENSSRALLRLWENMYYQYQSGLFDEAELEAEMVAWDRIMRNQPINDFWNSYREEYSEGFRTVIDSLVANHRASQ